MYQRSQASTFLQRELETNTTGREKIKVVIFNEEKSKRCSKVQVFLAVEYNALISIAQSRKFIGSTESQPSIVFLTEENQMVKIWFSLNDKHADPRAPKYGEKSEEDLKRTEQDD